MTTIYYCELKDSSILKLTLSADGMKADIFSPGKADEVTHAALEIKSK